jgi:serine/threonine protein kinase
MGHYAPGDEPIPGYRLVDWLGRGGFGDVWKAFGPGGAYLALKIMNVGENKNAVREYRALRQVMNIKHPNLVSIYGIWPKDKTGKLIVFPETEEPDSVWIKAHSGELIFAMDLGEKSLARRLEECREGGLAGIPTDELLDYMTEAARGIDYLNHPSSHPGSVHKPTQHCDLKPANILVVGGSIKVCDFGLARPTDVRISTNPAATIPYVPPEYLIKEQASPSTDQYSLAVTYYELRTGYLPFPDPVSQFEMMSKIVQGKLDFTKIASKDETTVLRRATSPDPASRYPTVKEMVAELRRAVGEKTTSSKKGTSPRPKSLPDLLKPGAEIVPGYKLVEFISEGGFGAVWKARSPGGVDTALKIVLDPQGLGAKEFESLALFRSIRHIHLLQLQAFWLLDQDGEVIPDEMHGQEGGPAPRMLVIATELADKSLKDELSNNKPGAFPVDKLLTYMEQAAGAIDYLNARSIQHRDIKPANLLLVGDALKVADFGLAKVLKDKVATLQRKSRAWTLAYVAPEIINDHVTSTSDQYSLAITYYHLRTGSEPFPDAASEAYIMKMHLDGTLDLSGVSEAERIVLERATMVDPKLRYPSTSKMVQALREAVFPPPVVPFQPTQPPTPERFRVPNPPQAGDEIVPGYHLQVKIGSGGFGEVWQASGPAENLVAIKVIPDLAGLGGHELKSLDLIKSVRHHPYLLGLHAYWLIDADSHIIPKQARGKADSPSPKRLVMATDLADKNLRQRLNECQEQNGKDSGIPKDELFKSIKQAAEAIDYLNTPCHHPASESVVDIRYDDGHETVTAPHRSGPTAVPSKKGATPTEPERSVSATLRPESLGPNPAPKPVLESLTSSCDWDVPLDADQTQAPAGPASPEGVTVQPGSVTLDPSDELQPVTGKLNEPDAPTLRRGDDEPAPETPVAKSTPVLQDTYGRKGLAIIHRDIKPENILLIGGNVKVADFGLAKLLEGKQAALRKESAAITIAYAPPEFFHGKVSERSDQYSLAVTYYHLRTGKLPFSVASRTGAIASHKSGALDLGGLKGREREIIKRAAALEPEARYGTCMEMVAELEKCLFPEQIADPRIREELLRQQERERQEQRRRIRRRVTAVAVGVSIFALAFAGWYFSPQIEMLVAEKQVRDLITQGDFKNAYAKLNNVKAALPDQVAVALDEEIDSKWINRIDGTKNTRDYGKAIRDFKDMPAPYQIKHEEMKNQIRSEWVTSARNLQTGRKYKSAKTIAEEIRKEFSDNNDAADIHTNSDSRVRSLNDDLESARLSAESNENWIKTSKILAKLETDFDTEDFAEEFKQAASLREKALQTGINLRQTLLNHADGALGWKTAIEAFVRAYDVSQQIQQRDGTKSWARDVADQFDKRAEALQNTQRLTQAIGGDLRKMAAGLKQKDQGNLLASRISAIVDRFAPLPKTLPKNAQDLVESIRNFESELLSSRFQAAHDRISKIKPLLEQLQGDPREPVEDALASSSKAFLDKLTAENNPVKSGELRAICRIIRQLGATQTQLLFRIALADALFDLNDKKYSQFCKSLTEAQNMDGFDRKEFRQILVAAAESCDTDGSITTDSLKEMTSLIRAHLDAPQSRSLDKLYCSLVNALVGREFSKLQTKAQYIELLALCEDAKRHGSQFPATLACLAECHLLQDGAEIRQLTEEEIQSLRASLPVQDVSPKDLPYVLFVQGLLEQARANNLEAAKLYKKAFANGPPWLDWQIDHRRRKAADACFKAAESSLAKEPWLAFEVCNFAIDLDPSKLLYHQELITIMEATYGSPSAPKESELLGNEKVKTIASAAKRLLDRHAADLKGVEFYRACILAARALNELNERRAAFEKLGMLISGRARFLDDVGFDEFYLRALQPACKLGREIRDNDKLEPGSGPASRLATTFAQVGEAIFENARPGEKLPGGKNCCREAADCYADAITLYSPPGARDRSLADYHAHRGMALNLIDRISLKDIEDIGQDWRYAKEVDPKNPWALALEGCARQYDASYRLGPDPKRFSEYEASLTAFDKAIELTSREPGQEKFHALCHKWACNVGVHYASDLGPGQGGKILEILTKAKGHGESATRLDANNEENWCALGNALEDLAWKKLGGKSELFQEAEKAFRRAHQLRKSYIYGAMALARCNIKWAEDVPAQKIRLQEARTVLENDVLAFRSKDAEANYWMGRLLLRTGNEREKAISYFTDAIAEPQQGLNQFYYISELGLSAKEWAAVSERLAARAAKQKAGVVRGHLFYAAHEIGVSNSPDVLKLRKVDPDKETKALEELRQNESLKAQVQQLIELSEEALKDIKDPLIGAQAREKAASDWRDQFYLLPPKDRPGRIKCIDKMIEHAEFSADSQLGTASNDAKFLVQLYDFKSLQAESKPDSKEAIEWRQKALNCINNRLRKGKDPNYDWPALKATEQKEIDRLQGS